MRSNLNFIRMLHMLVKKLINSQETRKHIEFNQSSSDNESHGVGRLSH